MTRVSLKEAYDNKDVVAQIYAIRDIAEGAENNANSALSTANTASGHVDALVPQVEGAVQNANNASASAQASAQTVTGYENRLSDVELKITTAEGQIVTIQGRVTALETADGQNVKLTGAQTIGGVKHFADPPTAPTTATGLWGVQVANGEKVKNELDNYAPMVRTTGNQNITGTKIFSGTISSSRNFDATVNPDSVRNLVYALNQVDANGVQLFNIWCQQLTSGKLNIYLGIRNTDGSQKNVLLGASD